jgi:hypothetical protein
MTESLLLEWKLVVGILFGVSSPVCLLRWSDFYAGLLLRRHADIKEPVCDVGSIAPSMRELYTISKTSFREIFFVVGPLNSGTSNIKG